MNSRSNKFQFPTWHFQAESLHLVKSSSLFLFTVHKSFSRLISTLKCIMERWWWVMGKGRRREFFFIVNMLLKVLMSILNWTHSFVNECIWSCNDELRLFIVLDLTSRQNHNRLHSEHFLLYSATFTNFHRQVTDFQINIFTINQIETWLCYKINKARQADLATEKFAETQIELIMYVQYFVSEWSWWYS